MSKPTEHNESPGFGLPDGYFLRSAAALRNRLEWEEEHRGYPLLSASRTQAFTIPEGYFGTGELALELAPFELLRKKSGLPFLLPEGSLAASRRRIHGALNVPIHDERKSGARVIWLYRVASMAALLIVVLAVWMYNRAGMEERDCGALACVDRIDILKSQKVQDLDNEDLFELADPATLERRLGLQPAGDDSAGYYDPEP